ncbi:MAG: hypothetical protein OHK0046_07640 [Anaerolineae bacterium]
MERLTRVLRVIIFLILIFGGSIANAQDNLLTNPGFEAPFVDKTIQGEAPRAVANGWEPWHVPPASGSSSAENQQPEYFETAPDSTRIRSGQNAQGYFTFFATHTGGVYQRVTGVTPGTELRFSVYAWVWSSSFEDVNQSEDPGDVIVYVGIDPTGGTDGTSSNIVWSPPAPDQYDAYREYSVIATASSNAVTVFVRSVVDFPVQNNFIYLDDAVLAATTSAQPTPTETQVVQQPSATPTVTVTTAAATATNTQVTGQDPTPTREGPSVITPDPSNVPPFVTVNPTATSTPTPTPTTPAPIAASATPSATQQTSGGNPTPATPSEVFQSSIVHTVQRGDTVSRIAVLYGSTTQAIITANSLNEDALIFVGQGLIIPVRQLTAPTTTPSATPVVVVITATQNVGVGGGVTGTVYIVRPGDTLNRIARQFNTTVAELARLNGIVNPNIIQAGQSLIISAAGQPPVVIQPTSAPPVTQPTTYVVRPGDNLYRISLRFNVSMAQLVAANNIANVNRIFAGQTLIIP